MKRLLTTPIDELLGATLVRNLLATLIREEWEENMVRL